MLRTFTDLLPWNRPPSPPPPHPSLPHSSSFRSVLSQSHSNPPLHAPTMSPNSDGSTPLPSKFWCSLPNYPYRLLTGLFCPTDSVRHETRYPRTNEASFMSVRDIQGRFSLGRE
ncbi:hypothetical protein K440DRAFT_56928 [Wilcoxina mikolae CBS 423.85]|nr:hypothetical protein K440DRAFT_56928 [Wilcoxina mikolae CBS 423.85]